MDGNITYPAITSAQDRKRPSQHLLHQLLAKAPIVLDDPIAFGVLIWAGTLPAIAGQDPNRPLSLRWSSSSGGRCPWPGERKEETSERVKHGRH